MSNNEWDCESNIKTYSNPNSITILPTPASHCQLEEIVGANGYINHNSRINGSVVALLTTTHHESKYHSSGRDLLVPVTRVWALVAQQENEVIDQLTTARDDANKLVNTLRARADLDKGEAKLATARIAELEKLTAAESARLSESDTALIQLRKQLHKLEDDLAKVRKHFGQKSYDEAISKP